MADEEERQPSKQPKFEIDPVRMQYLMQGLRDRQNLSAGIMAGAVAAIVGAVVWAALTAATGYQIGVMAIAIGWLVGWAVRKFGQGVDQSFGITGAVLALLGCACGNLLTGCIWIARENDVGYLEILNSLDWDTIVQIMTATFSPMDLVFYGIAAWFGYKYAFRPVTEEELRGAVRPS